MTTDSCVASRFEYRYTIFFSNEVEKQENELKKAKKGVRYWLIVSNGSIRNTCCSSNQEKRSADFTIAKKHHTTMGLPYLY